MGRGGTKSPEKDGDGGFRRVGQGTNMGNGDWGLCALSKRTKGGLSQGGGTNISICKNLLAAIFVMFDIINFDMGIYVLDGEDKEQCIY